MTRDEELALLTEVGPGTEMGALLRRFWQPVARSATVEPGRARPLRVLGEDLTLYRGESGRAYLIDGRCAHRRTLLHTGWVQGEEIRCVYHGWKYDGAGRCTEMPAEKETLPQTVRIPGYPLHEYGGLIFAWMGEGAAPEFDLPRKEIFERPDRMLFTREQVWPCHWLQQVENSLDAAHVSFVHHKGKVGPFGEAVTTAIPDLDYFETEAGIRQVATRSATNVRISDWVFPNNNHIILPSFRKDLPWLDLGLWIVPVDGTHTVRFQLYSIPSLDPERDRIVHDHFTRYAAYDPADHHDELFAGRYPEEVLLELTNAQDYVAAVGQGAVAERRGERLGRSDAGIALLRRILFRELEAAREGKPVKRWTRLVEAQHLPVQGPAAASG